MTRIPSHSIEDAPQAARSLLAEMVQFSPTGRLLNLHAQMAHAPAVLEAYVSIRRATAWIVSSTAVATRRRRRSLSARG